MQEDFLHYLWKHKKFDVLDLKTSKEESIAITSVGTHNLNTGPDFFNAQLKINEQLWAGNVEIHVKSSDWYLHNHETDSNYDNVILHVVWEHDADVFRNNNTVIPTLELKKQVSNMALNNYEKLFSKNKKWINCEKDFNGVDDFILNNWLERLFFERLERKSLEIETLLKTSNNNWEAVLFKMLSKNFGLKVNGEAFLSVANATDFSIIRKTQSKQMSLEALLFGQADLLLKDIQEPYYLELQKEFLFLKQKFDLSNSIVSIQFFRLRPANFPTIRLSQLATLYNKHQNVFSKIIESKTLEDIYSLFKVSASEFWDTHYTFEKSSRKIKKTLTKSFIELLLINTIIPLKFCYAKHQGKTIDHQLVNLIQSISSEKNSIVNKFNSLKPVSNSALDSQALLQLKNEYCTKNKCLQCVIGNSLLSRNM